MHRTRLQERHEFIGVTLRRRHNPVHTQIRQRQACCIASAVRRCSCRVQALIAPALRRASLSATAKTDILSAVRTAVLAVARPGITGRLPIRCRMSLDLGQTSVAAVHLHVAVVRCTPATDARNKSWINGSASQRLHNARRNVPVHAGADGIA